jgi:hypothetical protein
MKTATSGERKIACISAAFALKAEYWDGTPSFSNEMCAIFYIQELRRCTSFAHSDRPVWILGYAHRWLLGEHFTQILQERISIRRKSPQTREMRRPPSIAVSRKFEGPGNFRSVESLKHRPQRRHKFWARTRRGLSPRTNRGANEESNHEQTTQHRKPPA